MGTEGNRQVTLPFLRTSQPSTCSFPVRVFRGARISSLPANACSTKNMCALLCSAVGEPELVQLNFATLYYAKLTKSRPPPS